MLHTEDMQYKGNIKTNGGCLGLNKLLSTTALLYKYWMPPVSYDFKDATGQSTLELSLIKTVMHKPRLNQF